MINVTEQVRAANEAGNPPIELARFEFAGTPPVFLTTAGFDVQWSGETWVSNGFMLDSELINRVGDLRTSNSNIGLTGVDLTIAAILLNTPQVGRKVTIYEAFVSSSGAVIPNPTIKETLFIDEATIEQNEESAIVVLKLSGEWADFEFKAGIRTTEASLQRYHAGDKLFQFSKSVKKTIKWGGE